MLTLEERVAGVFLSPNSNACCSGDLRVWTPGKPRYVQLPINAGMREGWEQPWQAIRPEGQPAGAAASLKLPAVEAAARLGLGVFASGPLGEGSLLEDKKLLVLRSSSKPSQHPHILKEFRVRGSCERVPDNEDASTIPFTI